MTKQSTEVWLAREPTFRSRWKIPARDDVGRLAWDAKAAALSFEGRRGRMELPAPRVVVEAGLPIRWGPMGLLLAAVMVIEIIAAANGASPFILLGVVAGLVGGAFVVANQGSWLRLDFDGEETLFIIPKAGAWMVTKEQVGLLKAELEGAGGQAPAA